MLAHAYAVALNRAIRSGTNESKACDALVATLVREGKQALLPTILRAYERLTFAQKRSGTTITVAKESDTNIARTHCKKIFNTEDAVVRIDDTIIGGYAIEHNSKRIDNTYKSALLSMYRSITTH